MKKYTAPVITVTKIEIESAILAASMESSYLTGDDNTITDKKNILSNQAVWEFMEEEGE